MEEYEFTYDLGNIIKTAREKAGLTQEQLAALADIKLSNTILHIENYRGNPKLKVLYPLIRVLKIDANDLFYPESHQSSSALRQLQLMISSCSEEEAVTLISILEPIMAAIRNKNAKEI
ncbi:MAG: helix-turn-helix domain-containing protein [Lachnospiraceae bacterium]|nr:helix-turn-helix domain-containing protein [Lachnospiraceae bacterium]